MKYCIHCGEQIKDDAAFCSVCGEKQAEIEQAWEPAQNVPAPTAPPAIDNGGFLWGLLGFLVPVAGLVLFLLWKEERPKTAKAAGIGALISAAAGIVLIIVYIIFIIIFAVVMGTSY